MGTSPSRPGPWRVWIALAAVLTATGLGVAGIRRWTAPSGLEQGWSAYRESRWNDALSFANQRLKEDSNDREALRLRTRASARLQQDDITIAGYLRLQSEDAKAEDFFLLGDALFRQGDATAGEQMWQRALSADPAHAETIAALTRQLVRTDRLAEAADLALRLAGSPGWEARGKARLGLIRYDQLDFASAVEALHGALSIDSTVNGPDFSTASLLRQLAHALLRLRRTDEAETVLRTVLKAGPDREAQWLLSRVGLQRGDRAAALASWKTATSAGPLFIGEPAPYVGSASCEECHAELYDTQQSSRHARTFHHASEVAGLNLPSQTYNDPEDPRVIATVNSGTKPVSLQVATGSELIRAVMTYVLGSGRHALTPIGRDEDGVLRELRLTYYADISSWDVTPGHPLRPGDPHGYLGERLTDDSLRRCLSCHMTNHRAAAARTGPEAADLGIGCERCHGPGGNHAAAVETSFPDFAIASFRRNGSRDSPRVMTLCGECHGTRGREILQDNPAATVRFQGTTLTWSKCYEKSRQRFDCLTCHSAHRSADESPSFYEAKCLSCHAAEAQTPAGRLPVASEGSDLAERVVCPVNPRVDCVKCHMPKVPSIVPHAMFTDHQIRVHRGSVAGNGPRPK
jgi:tetratricopeptide (TPR) repeat protein